MLQQVEVGLGCLSDIRVQTSSGALPQPWAQNPWPPCILYLVITILCPSWNENWCHTGFLPAPVSKVLPILLAPFLCNLEESNRFYMPRPLALITCSLPQFWRDAFCLPMSLRSSSRLDKPVNFSAFPLGWKYLLYKVWTPALVRGPHFQVCSSLDSLPQCYNAI